MVGKCPLCRNAVLLRQGNVREHYLRPFDFLLGQPCLGTGAKMLPGSLRHGN